MNYFGFINYAVFVFGVTGILLLLQDVKAYKHARLQKERKTAKILGWTNLSLGSLFLLANWIYQKWFWWVGH